MKLLLDTHSFIWWHEDPSKLSPTAFQAISAKTNDIYLGIPSLWEMQIKLQSGKLKLVDALGDIVKVEMSANNFKLLQIEVDHILGLQNLPMIHKDPFDRLLISQARVENMRLVTSDTTFPPYGITILW